MTHIRLIHVFSLQLQAVGWLNPAVNVSVNGKIVPSLGIWTSVVDDFAQVTSRVNLCVSHHHHPGLLTTTFV